MYSNKASIFFTQLRCFKSLRIYIFLFSHSFLPPGEDAKIFYENISDHSSSRADNASNSFMMMIILYEDTFGNISCEIDVQNQ